MAPLVEGGVGGQQLPCSLTNKIQHVKLFHLGSHLLNKGEDNLPSELWSTMWFWAAPHTSLVSVAWSL